MIVTEAKMPNEVTASNGQDWLSRRRNNQVTRDKSCMKLSRPPGSRNAPASEIQSSVSAPDSVWITFGEN